jgi:hypothetical protein
MDNDTIRRDNDSFHIKYGIEYTNFFIYYMFNTIGLELDTCFDNSLNNDDDAFDIKIQNITIINDIKHIINLNMNLLIEGQYNDLEWNNSTSNNSINIQTLHSNPNHFLKEKDVIFELNNSNPTALLIQFDNYTGPRLFAPDDPRKDWIPINIFDCYSTETKCTRKQFPTKLAYALTIHKSQGATLKKAVIDLGSCERTLGLTFVALSRIVTTKIL